MDSDTYLFEATINKKQVTMDYLWGKGPGGAMNCFLFYTFLHSWNFLILHIYYFLLKMSQGLGLFNFFSFSYVLVLKNSYG